MSWTPCCVQCCPTALPACPPIVPDKIPCFRIPYEYPVCPPPFTCTLCAGPCFPPCCFACEGPKQVQIKVIIYTILICFLFIFSNSVDVMLQTVFNGHALLQNCCIVFLESFYIR